MRLPVPFALVGLLLAGCQALPGPGSGPAATAADASAAVLAERLPVEAAGFRRGAIIALPLGTGGREVGYRTAGLTAAGATVELYGLPSGHVPEGTGSQAAAEAFDQLVQDATRPLPPRRLLEAGRFELPAAGTPTLRCAETAGIYGRERVQGLLCAGGVSGGLLRLRMTMPERDPPVADARAFATAILAALRGP